jgi:uncharacterized protein (UPF0262 family)
MPSATLEDLRIDEATWNGGSPERKHEWRLAIHEILEEGSFEIDPPAPGPLMPGPFHALVGIKARQVILEVRTAGGQPVAEHSLPLDRIEPLMNEYIATIVEMSKLGVSTNSPRLEALDIAKRLTHDEAGELIVTELATLRPDHATARRLFTLLVTILHDTTKLAAAMPHPARY